jgi:hypothetical protein
MLQVYKGVGPMPDPYPFSDKNGNISSILIQKEESALNNPILAI